MCNICKYFTANILLLAFILLMSSCGGKKDLLSKEWNATELTLGETKLAGSDLGGVKYAFNPDGAFSYSESDKTETGKWALIEDGGKIILTFSDGRVVQQNVKELSAEKLILDYDDHGMHRTVTLSPLK